MDLNDVPIIGQPTSIPADKVIEAMQSLEAELREFYGQLAADLDDKLVAIQYALNEAALSSDRVDIKLIQDIIGED